MTVDEIYEIICRIEAGGGDPDDEETWERYAAEFRPYAESDAGERRNHEPEQR